MHTPLCRHATGEPVDYARRAVEIGLTEIGFSDHSPMRKDDFDEWRMRNDQLDEYVGKVRQAQHDFPLLTIRLALEVDYLPGHEAWIRDLAARHPWDYLIGSVHYVSDTWAVDSPHKLSEWKNRDPFEVWSIYFERLTMAAETGLFDYLRNNLSPSEYDLLRLKIVDNLAYKRIADYFPNSNEQALRCRWYRLRIKIRNLILKQKV